MRRLVIAIDCDDVLIPSQEFLVDTYNHLYGTSVELGQDFEEIDAWGVGYDEVMRRCGEIARTDRFKNLEPDPEAVETINRLATVHELHLVTARQEKEQAFTKIALDKVLPEAFVAMEFIGWKGSKGDVCARIGADVLIDDSLGHLYDAIQKGLWSEGAILFGDYPWQASELGRELIKRCRDWSAVEREVGVLCRMR